MQCFVHSFITSEEMCPFQKARQEKHRIHKMYLCVYIHIIYMYIIIRLSMSSMSGICQYVYILHIYVSCILKIFVGPKCSKIQIHQGLPIFPQFTRTNHRLEKFVRTSPARFSGQSRLAFFLHGRC